MFVCSTIAFNLVLCKTLNWVETAKQRKMHHERLPLSNWNEFELFVGSKWCIISCLHCLSEPVGMFAVRYSKRCENKMNLL